MHIYFISSLDICRHEHSLCFAGHWLFGAVALLSFYYFAISIEPGIGTIYELWIAGLNENLFIIWKIVLKNLQLFETCREKRFSNRFLRHFRKLIHFSGETRLFVKFTAKKELSFLFLITPSRGLYNH